MWRQDPDKAPLTLAELVKCHKVKMRSVEDVLINFGRGGVEFQGSK